MRQLRRNEIFSTCLEDITLDPKTIYRTMTANSIIKSVFGEEGTEKK